MPEQEDVLAQLEADIHSIAAKAPNLAAERPRMVFPTQLATVTSIGAGAVGKRLEGLLERAEELARQAEVLATGLAGPAPAENKPALNLRNLPREAGTEPLFVRQLGGLDELGRMLDTVGRAIERASRSLA
jgi:hypothetical protein